MFVLLLFSFLYLLVCTFSSFLREMTQFSFLYLLICTFSSFLREMTQFSFLYLLVCTVSSFLREIRQFSFLYLLICTVSSFLREMTQFSFLYFLVCTISSFLREMTQNDPQWLAEWLALPSSAHKLTWVWIPLGVQFSSWLYGVSLHRVFHYHRLTFLSLNTTYPVLANCVDPDQLASEEANWSSDLDLHCLSLNMWISIKTPD